MTSFSYSDILVNIVNMLNDTLANTIINGQLTYKHYASWIYIPYNTAEKRIQ